MELLLELCHFRQAVSLLLLFAGIPLLVGLLVGLSIAVVQAATQVQEQTLNFVPKLLAIFLVLYFTSDWMMLELQSYFSELAAGVEEFSLARS